MTNVSRKVWNIRRNIKGSLSRLNKVSEENMIAGFKVCPAKV